MKSQIRKEVDSKKTLYCRVCGNPRQLGSRLCRECYLKHKREQARKRGRYVYHKICAYCGKEYAAWRKNDSGLCGPCWRRKVAELKTTGYNSYLPAGGGGYCWKHRKIAEQILDRKLDTNEVVHHLDGNPHNNMPNNLIIISRKDHGRLHAYLRLRGALLEKSKSENPEDCWESLIVPMTTTWLETTGVKVIKLWEIGRSAGELPKDNKGEASETMHWAPDQKC